MPSVKVDIKPELITWARERSGLAVEDLIEKVPNLLNWESGEKRPTLNQLENFARRTRTPLGYLFLENPPEEKFPIPYYRTPKDKPISRPSPDLLETVQTMQRRQAWMREYLIMEKENPLPFVGSVNINSDIVAVAANIRDALGLQVNWARNYTWWAEAAYALREAADRIGILVTRNGIVGNNVWRKLNVEEFRGFVLVEQYSPLIFLNGRDYEGPQMFTLVHELAHVWLGRGSAFNLLNLQPFDEDGEKFCNMVAAEFLVPQKELRDTWRTVGRMRNPFDELARQYKVSSIVIARRALDLNLISRDRFFDFYERYREEQENRLREGEETKKQGGNFYNTQNVRIGKRFASAVFYAAKEGRILYRDAFRLTGLHGATFDKYFQKLGIA